VSKRPLDAWQAAARGNVPALKKLREQGVDLSSADYDRRYARSLAGPMAMPTTAPPRGAVGAHHRYDAARRCILRRPRATWRPSST